MGRLGVAEVLLILGVTLLLFGGTRIAGIGKGLGEGIKNFKKGIRDDEPPRLAKQSGNAPARLPAKKAEEAKSSQLSSLSLG